MKTINVEIENITDAQAIALEDMFRTWVNLGNLGSSRWTSFYADGDGNFRPKIKVDGKDAKFSDLIDEEMRNKMWKENEYKIDFDMIGWNFYMMPELAARGLLLMNQFYQGETPKKNEDLEMPYPDLSKFPIYTQHNSDELYINSPND